MKYEASAWAITVFVTFVSFVLWMSYYFAKKTKSAKSYYAAGGNIHWAVNGIAFAGDYLSAASFLGICGMIATAGYDGFLYSIGYLAGWIVALFVVAEPMKKLGKYTFTDALDSKFNSKSIQLVAAISTLVVSLFYLIPQMVGAGVIVTPLLGLPHWAGVMMVGTIVIIIVATAGMTSTTYVQFLKGGLLVIFSTALTVALFTRGFSVNPETEGHRAYKTVAFTKNTEGGLTISDSSYAIAPDWGSSALYSKGVVKLVKDGAASFWKMDETKGLLLETQSIVDSKEKGKLYNGAPRSEGLFFPVGSIATITTNGEQKTEVKNLDPISFLSTLKDSTIITWASIKGKDGESAVTLYYPKEVKGADLLTPGQKFKVDSDKGASWKDKLNFVSLMLALFLGTAALPHILIRYYTVPSPACARKSTIVAIAAIGFFYVLTLYMGLGAMVSGVLDMSDTNMAAPLLAKSFGIFLFAVISAIAFATVLGTVSGLIVAASGAIARDIIHNFLGKHYEDDKQVKIGKIASVCVGVVAMILGVIFEGMNVSFLVGWAFAVAASANLPAVVMLLFWKKTTAKGIAASVLVGLVSAMALILVSPEMYVQLYGLKAENALFGIDSPTIVTVPLSFITLVVVSLLTQPKKEKVLEGEFAVAK